MIYLHRGLDRAACETEERAQALEARGYKRCSAAVHRALWAIADATQQARLRAQASPQPQGTVTAPIGGSDNPPAVALEGVVTVGHWTIPRKYLPGGWE